MKIFGVKFGAVLFLLASITGLLLSFQNCGVSQSFSSPDAISTASNAVYECDIGTSRACPSGNGQQLCDATTRRWQACVVPQANYFWSVSVWSGCSAACGGGTQSRSVSCRDRNGASAASSSCPAAVPATSQSCQPQACPVDDATANAACRAQGGSVTSRADWAAYDRRYPNAMYCCNSNYPTSYDVLTKNGWGLAGGMPARAWGTGELGDCGIGFTR